MIFITVGTHEQGLDRLLMEVDILIESKIINEEVFAQIGYSKYIPRNYKYKKMISYDLMDEYVRKGDIVITHGGPGSIFHPLQYGKIPIVVPRNKKFKEHIDNHQIFFAKRMEMSKKIIAIYDISDLKYAIKNYNEMVNQCNNKSEEGYFVEKFDRLIKERFTMI